MKKQDRPAGRALLEKLPWLPPGRFVSDINTAASDVYVLSFVWEASSLLYKSKSTGMVLPLKSELIGNVGFDAVDYRKIAGRAAAAGLTEADWTFLREEFAFVGPLDESQLAADIQNIFATLRGKIVIVVMLNTKVGQAPRLLKLHERINAVVRPLAEAHDVETIDTNEFVQGPDDLAQPNDNGGNFKPRILPADRRARDRDHRPASGRSRGGRRRRRYRPLTAPGRPIRLRQNVRRI